MIGELDNEAIVVSLLREKRYFIIDLDGVVCAGSELIARADAAIESFRSLGKVVFFLTNNSSSHPKSIVKKLERLGVPCPKSEVLNSGLAAALYLRKQGYGRAPGVFLIGTTELGEVLFDQGVRLSRDPHKCSALLVGHDPDFNYGTIQKGLAALNRGVPFIVCNRDTTYPGEGGAPMPACGAMVGALEGAARRRPDHEIGKPGLTMLKLVLGRLRARPGECLVFGDTLDTDIAMANNAGIDSLWVCAPRAARSSRMNGVRPTARVATLSEAAALLRVSPARRKRG